MTSGLAIRRQDEGAVRRLVLCRPEAYNTITPALRDELGAALDAADRDDDVRVVLLSAEGPAFCAGFGLDWSTAPREGGEGAQRVWDTVADVQVVGRFGKTFAKLHEINDVARHQYQPDTSRLLGFIFDGVARHTQEGLDFVARAQAVGWRQAVRDRDQPFGDYGERDPSGHGSGASVGDAPRSPGG